MYLLKEAKEVIYYLDVNIADVLRDYELKIFATWDSYELKDIYEIATGRMIDQDSFIINLVLNCGYNPLNSKHINLNFIVTGDFVDRVGAEIPINHLTQMSLTITYNKEIEEDD